MATPNTKKIKSPLPIKIKEENPHLNHMGGNSWDLSNPIQKLKIAASSCFFAEPMYYNHSVDLKKESPTKRNSNLSVSQANHLDTILGSSNPKEWRNLSPKALMEKTIDEALSYDLEKTLQVAVELRNEDYIRTTPQVILVRAANLKNSKGEKASPKGQPTTPNPIVKYAKEIIKRADEPAVGLAYQLSCFGKDKPIPASLKKAWKYSLEGFNEYNLAKYKMENRQVSTLDVVRLAHPSGMKFKKLRNGELKNTETWEAILSSEGSNTESWSKSIEVMGHMALLRNLRNLFTHNVPLDLYKDKFLNGAKEGKQLPFRYYSAFLELQKVDNISTPILDMVEEALNLSLTALEPFKGKVISLCDNSGSAKTASTSSMGQMQISSIGNLMGVLTGKISDDGYIGVFGDQLKVINVRKNSSIFDTLKEAEDKGDTVGGGTENGVWLFWDKAIKNKEIWNHVFIYSDMQCGHGGLYGINQNAYKDYIFPSSSNKIDVPKLINEYRKKVNPDVMVYLVQIAGEQDTIVPDYYDKTFILGGWTDGILKFAAKMNKKYNKQ